MVNQSGLGLGPGRRKAARVRRASPCDNLAVVLGVDKRPEKMLPDESGRAGDQDRPHDFSQSSSREVLRSVRRASRGDQDRSPYCIS